jgi:hypothetical protein
VVFEVYCGNVDIGILKLSRDVGNVQRGQRLVGVVSVGTAEVGWKEIKI